MPMMCAVSPDDRSPSQRGEVRKSMTSGSMAYPAVKAKRDCSMPLKREGREDVYRCVLQDPRAMVTARLPEPQPPAMQAYIPRPQRLLRGHSDRASKSSALEPSAGWAVRNDRTQGGG